MKLDKTTISLTALAVTAALVAVVFLQESSKPTSLAETASDSLPAIGAATRPNPNYRAFTEALTEREQVMLAELQQDFDPEELERIFNPLTFEERQQSTYGTFDHLANASRKYYQYWAEFVDNLGLSPEDAQFVRDIWIGLTARSTELGALALDVSHEEIDISAALADVDNQLYSMLSEILSPEQMTAFFDHEEQLVTDTLAFSQAYQNELIDGGHSGLISAADDNDLAAVQAYLASGADPNRMATDGQSAIHEAASSNNPEILGVLIDAGADVNLVIPGGWSALMEASLFGSTDVVRILVEAGANLEYTPSDNPLHNALNFAALNGHTDIVRVLLDAGADASGIVGEVALENAIGFGDQEMEQMLIEAGANANSPQVLESRRFFDLGRRLGLVRD